MNYTMTIAARQNPEGLGRSVILHALGTSTRPSLLNCGNQSRKAPALQSETVFIILA
jgi:hypothetical protein